MTKKLPWQLILLLLSVRLAAAEPDKAKAGNVDVLTSRYSADRAGANLRESILTVAGISGSRFGKLFEHETRGDIYAQPLIKTAVEIPGLGNRDLVYIATAENHLYAFDATSASERQPYWYVDPTLLGVPAARNSVTDLASGQKYLNFESKIGIIATPAIDDKSNTIYLTSDYTVASADPNG